MIAVTLDSATESDEDISVESQSQSECLEDSDKALKRPPATKRSELLPGAC
jgi:hypothetical protein